MMLNRRGSTNVSEMVCPAPTMTFWSGAGLCPGTLVVSTTQYWPGTMFVSEQLPSAPVVQEFEVAVSSAPCGGAPSSGGLSTYNVNTAPWSALPASSCLWMLIRPRARSRKVHVTVSPTPTSMFVTGLPSLQVALVRSQPAGTASAAL